MIEEQARVASVNQQMAELIVEKQSACGSCSAKSGCGTSLLAAWLPKRQLSIRLSNDIGAKPGDTVVVGLDEAQLQRSSLLLYAFPLAGLLIGAIAGEQMFAFLALPAELGAVLMGLLGVTAALIYVRHLSMTKLRTSNSGVRMLRLVDSGPAFAPDDIAMPEMNQYRAFRDE